MDQLPLLTFNYDRDTFTEEAAMHFIEQIFHIEPDGGTEILELATALIFVMFPLGVVALRTKRRRDA